MPCTDSGRQKQTHFLSPIIAHGSECSEVTDSLRCVLEDFCYVPTPFGSHVPSILHIVISGNIVFLYSSMHNKLTLASVGGNAVSAFLSWRLQATNACDVTLVWKSGFDNVAQYGISFRYEHGLLSMIMADALTVVTRRSALFGNERFKPRSGTPH